MWSPNTKYEKRIWRCGNKHAECRVPRLSAEEAGGLFLKAKRELTENSELYLSLLPRLYTSPRVLEVCRLEKDEIESAGYDEKTSPRLTALLSFMQNRQDMNAYIDRALLTNDTSSLPANTPEMLIDCLEILDRDNITTRYIPSYN